MSNYGQHITSVLISCLIISCSGQNDSNSESILPENNQVEIEETKGPIETPEFEIINKSNFIVDLILEGAKGQKYYSPSGEFYYFIGQSKIKLVEGKTNYLIIPNWNLNLKKDTVIFEKRNTDSEELPSTPLASLNAQYNKYNIGTSYKSENFGNISLSENGFSCDDSYSGQIDIGNEDSLITIKGLANIELFEAKNGKELYVVSYHNCLAPDLKIIRVKI